MVIDGIRFDPAAAQAHDDDVGLWRQLAATLATRAAHHADLLSRARCDANWLASAHRLRALGASFDAIELREAGEFALASAPGDPVAIRRAQSAALALHTCG